MAPMALMPLMALMTLMTPMAPMIDDRLRPCTNPAVSSSLP
jgi:hypothetical protein